MLKPNAIHRISALSGLQRLPDASVDCLLTSPPYWALRDYGKQTVAVWDGDRQCRHAFSRPSRTGNLTVRGKRAGASRRAHPAPNWTGKEAGVFCRKCGAWRGQLGLEPTMSLYLKHLAAIFDEARRVLKPSGTCFVNLADTYHNLAQWPRAELTPALARRRSRSLSPGRRPAQGLPEKSLSLIPFRFAIKMVERGWTLRNVIIWHKPNCQPESVKDRFTVDFDYLFFFSKSPHYHFEPQYEAFRGPEPAAGRMTQGRQHRQGKWTRERLRANPTAPKAEPACTSGSLPGRNRRCVWTIPTQPLPKTHFTTYPEALCEIPIRAGCPARVCRKCGKPWQTRYEAVQQQRGWDEAYWSRFLLGSAHPNRHYREALAVMKRWMTRHRNYHYADFYAAWRQRMQGSWGRGSLRRGQQDKLRGSLPFPRPERRLAHKHTSRAACACRAGFRPGLVLDPFLGSGTTAVVARRLGRDYLGFELNPRHVTLARQRISAALPTRQKKPVRRARR